MSAIIIFFSSMFCILFFLIEVVFKIAISAFGAILNAIGKGIGYVLYVALCLCILAAICGVVEVTTGVDAGGDTIGSILVLSIFSAVAIYVILGNIGKLIVGIIITIVNHLLCFVANVLGKCGNVAEGAFEYFMNVLEKQVQKDFLYKPMQEEEITNE